MHSGVTVAAAKQVEVAEPENVPWRSMHAHCS